MIPFEQIKNGELVAVVSEKPIKSTSSSGSWVVNVVIKVPFGNGKTHGNRYFWKKADAIKFIADTNKVLLA